MFLEIQEDFLKLVGSIVNIIERINVRKRDTIKVVQCLKH